MRIILPIMVALVGMFFFTQCKKDHSCKMRVTCCYSSNGMDADSVVPYALITFDTVKYNSGVAVLPEIAEVVNMPSNRDGVFEYTLAYPALLIVNAEKIDTVFDQNGGVVSTTRYTGTAQVQVNEGETTEKTILMVETN